MAAAGPRRRGNLYASVLLRPDCAMAAATQLSLVAGPGARRGAGRARPAGRRAAAQMAERRAARRRQDRRHPARGHRRCRRPRRLGRRRHRRQPRRAAPTACGYPATCLAREGFAALAPETVLAAYLRELDRWLEQWRAAGFGAVRRAWLARGFGLGAEIRLRACQRRALRPLARPHRQRLAAGRAGRRPPARDRDRGRLLPGPLSHGRIIPAAGDRRGQHQHRVRALPRARALGQWRISTVRERTADEYAAALTQLMALKGFDQKDVGAAVISSVVPQALIPLQEHVPRVLRLHRQGRRREPRRHDRRW